MVKWRKTVALNSGADLPLEEDIRQLADEVFAEVCQQRHVESGAGEEHATHQALAHWCIVWNTTKTLKYEDMSNIPNPDVKLKSHGMSMHTMAGITTAQGAHNIPIHRLSHTVLKYLHL